MKTIIVPCDLIINIQLSRHLQMSKKPLCSLIKCLREISSLFDFAVGNIKCMFPVVDPGFPRACRGERQPLIRTPPRSATKCLQVAVRKIVLAKTSLVSFARAKLRLLIITYLAGNPF